MQTESGATMKLAKLWIGTLALLFSSLSFAAVTYSYDNLNRLTAVNYGNGTSQAYSYDPAGNLLNVTTLGASSGTVPGAPTIVNATADNGSATLWFAAPTSTGGATISGYKATCGTTTVSGTSSPITVAPLSNGTTYACTVRATNSVGDSAPSTPTYVMPSATGTAPTCTLTAS